MVFGLDTYTRSRTLSVTTSEIPDTEFKMTLNDNKQTELLKVLSTQRSSEDQVLWKPRYI